MSKKHNTSYLPDDTVSDDTVSDDTVSDDVVSDDAVSDDAVSDDAVSDDAVSDDAVSDVAVDNKNKYVVAEGKTLVTKKGILTAGTIVQVEYFNSRKAFDTLIDRKFIVRK
jgi:hypothetical protein